MARQWIPPRGFQRPWIRYSEGIRESVETNPLAMNNFLEVMRRPADPEVALRKHSELKKPWQFRDISIMELTLGEIIDDFAIPPFANIQWPEGVRTYSRIVFPRIGFPKIGFTDSWRNREGWQLNRRPPMEPWEIPAAFPYEPQGVAPYPQPEAIVGQPGGQPAIIPPDMGKAFLAWVVYKGSTVWGYVAGIVIYNHDNAYSFSNAADLFSRMTLEPDPGWKSAGASDVGYFNQTDYTAGERRGGANVYNAPLPGGEMWGVSRLIEDGKRKFRAYWGIDYPPGTANNLDLILLESIRTGKCSLKIDGREVPVIGQSIMYRENNHYYWELNGNITAQLLLGDRLNYSYEEVAAVGYYPRLNVDEYYSQWPSGEHSD